MKLDKQALSAALKMVAPIISSNPIIPAQAGVKITEKYLTGGNSWVSVAVPVALGIPDSILDYQILSKAVNSLSEEIDLEMKGEVAVLKAVEGKVQVPVIGLFSEYPEMKQEFQHEAFTLTKEDVLALGQLANFTHNDGNPCFQGVAYNGEFFAAYDKIVFALYDKPTAFAQEVLFPKDLFRVLQNIGADEYDFNNGIVTAKSGDKKIAFVKYLLHNENFPPVKQVLEQQSFNKVSEVSQYNLSKAFDLLSISTDESTKTIELNFEPDSGITGITGKEEINTLSEISIESTNEGFDERFDIGFNIDRLAKALKFLGGSTVKLEVKAPTTACRIKSDIEGRSVIVMPIALTVPA